VEDARRRRAFSRDEGDNEMTTTEPSRIRLQTAVGAGVLLLGLALAAGAVQIPAAAGYGGVGPNFLPWLVAVSLAVCGVLIVREARTGGFRALEEEEGGAARPDWNAFVWVSAGLLANAALITSLGFILSCTLCYVLAVQGLRRAAGQPAPTARGWAIDALTGAAIAAPVFWMFTQFLAINLPGLTGTGWL
jgi:putative tricarboxylic transport membrane protein